MYLDLLQPLFLENGDDLQDVTSASPPARSGCIAGGRLNRSEAACLPQQSILLIIIVLSFNAPLPPLQGATR